MNQTIGLKEIIKLLLLLPRTLRILLQINHLLFISIILVNMFLGIMTYLNLWVLELFLDTITKGKDFQTNILSLFIMCGFMAISSIINIFSKYLSEKYSLKANYYLNCYIMELCSYLRYEDYEDADIYNKIQKIVGEIAYKPMVIFNCFISLIQTLFTFLSATIFMIKCNWTFVIAAVLLPSLTLYQYLRVGKLQFKVHWERADKERESWYYSYLLTHDFSIKELKINMAENYIVRKFNKLKSLFYKQDIFVLNKKCIVDFLQGIVGILIYLAVLTKSIFMLTINHISIGSIMGIIKAIESVKGGAEVAMQSITTIYNCSLFLKEFYSFIEYANKQKSSNTSHKANIVIDDIYRIKVINLSYKYPGKSNYALENINLNIKKGMRIAIVGENGSGKSTLVKLLAGLYTLQKGDILINDHSIETIESDCYKKLTSVLFQDYVKYEMTLLDNIKMGYPRENDEDKILELLHNIDIPNLKEEGNYDLSSQLGVWFENGRQLSGGEWQKVGLARTFYKDSRLFILDEPTSAIDPIAEKNVFTKFFELSQQNIAVFVSHRLLSAQKADYIIVLDNGRIVAQGNHQELIQSCKKYQDMYFSEIQGFDIKKM